MKSKKLLLWSSWKSLKQCLQYWYCVKCTPELIRKLLCQTIANMHQFLNNRSIKFPSFQFYCFANFLQIRPLLFQGFYSQPFTFYSITGNCVNSSLTHIQVKGVDVPLYISCPNSCQNKRH